MVIKITNIIKRALNIGLGQPVFTLINIIGVIDLFFWRGHNLNLDWMFYLY